ncbi:Hypothetical protein A7982_09380 [Minicystis rosea]|nr:Hypothetical protein A7982_09380 [Minicystis rosea]
MVAVPPLDVSAAEAKQAFIAAELAKLTPEEREEYESSAFFRGIVDLTLEQEWEHPGPTAAEREAAEKYGGDPIRCFVEEFVAFVLERHPQEATRIAALRAERYGADTAREAAAIQDGTHPIQQLR